MDTDGSRAGALAGSAGTAGAHSMPGRWLHSPRSKRFFLMAHEVRNEVNGQKSQQASGLCEKVPSSAYIFMKYRLSSSGGIFY